MTLKNEVSNLWEQLNHTNALNTLMKGSCIDPPTSLTFVPTLCGAENGDTNGSILTPYNWHQWRHSSAGVYALAPSNHHHTSTDKILIDIKKNQAWNPYAVSVGRIQWWG
jgi:myosin-5